MPPLRDDFERWARLSARMLRQSPADCARLVQNEGVAGEWHEADARWYAVLTDEVQRGSLDYVQRYRSICDEVLAERINAGEQIQNLIERFLPVAITNDDSTITVTDDDSTPKPNGAETVGPGGTHLDLGEGVTATPQMVEAALGWSIEQYTWLCAEVSEFEERAPDLWSARGVTDTASQVAVQRAWQQRLAEDAQLEEQHRRLLAGYRERLRSES